MKTKGKHKTSNFLNTYTSDHVVLMPKHLPEPLFFFAIKLKFLGTAF